MHKEKSSQAIINSIAKFKFAWLAIAALIAINLLCLILIRGSILISVFPISSLIIGLFLYNKYPFFYISFALWIWFLNGFVARLYSLQYGSLLPGGMSAAPLVSCISIFTFIQFFPKVIKDKDKIGIPFVMCIGSLFYSVLIRWLTNPSPGNIQAEFGAFFESLSPPLLAFYLYIHWKEYPVFRETIQKTFLWGVVILGGYGLFQFMTAPPWDVQSMLLTDSPTGGESWIGKPEPFSIRVFSTMANPYPFSINILTGLIFLLSIRKKGVIYLIATFVGYISFLLSLYRTAWYSWFTAVIVFLMSSKSKRQIQILGALLLILIVIFFMANTEPFSSRLSERFSTFSNLGNDASGQARQEVAQKFFRLALLEFVGKGFKVGDVAVSTSSTERYASLDMGFLEILFSLGWFGAIPYLIGIFILLQKLCWKSVAAQVDIFVIAARSVAVASIIRVMTSTILWGDMSISMWICLGIGMGAHKYYTYQQYLAMKSNSP
jgi:hypothetical protein